MTKTIGLRVVTGDEVHELETFEGEYRSLMMLIFERIYIPDFGDCNGMGRCGTCVVTVTSRSPIPGMDRNEQATIARSGRPSDPDHRLACQIFVDQLLQGAKVQVADM